MMMYRSFFAIFLTLLSTFKDHLVQGQGDYLNHAVAAANVLQNWYNETSGLYETTGWWNSANCITVLADLTILDPDISIVTGAVWANTLERAQQTNLQQTKAAYCTAAGCAAVKRSTGLQATTEERSVNASSNVQTEDLNPKGFLNGFFDDEGWWSLAWIAVYDLTGDEQYLKAAEQIFEDLRTNAVNATCGGVWWDRVHSANVAIANELFMSVAAHLANRVPAKQSFYMNYALQEWAWFSQSGLINAQNQINDSIDLQTCQNNGAAVWSYNQGVILGALVEMNKLQPNASYIDRATEIADAAIEDMTDANGVFHDPNEPNLGGDGNQFKGIFARNLQQLYKVTNQTSYKSFLQTNADSIWNTARNTTTGVITPVWSGPFDPVNANAASHSSGMDALVAAAAVQ